MHKKKSSESWLIFVILAAIVLLCIGILCIALCVRRSSKKEIERNVELQMNIQHPVENDDDDDDVEELYEKHEVPETKGVSPQGPREDSNLYQDEGKPHTEYL